MARIAGTLDLDDFAAWLRDTCFLAPSTVTLYTRTLRRVPDGTEPADWLAAQVDADTPIGTLRPLRAAVAHYLRFVSGEQDVADSMPPIPRRRRRQTYARDALSAEGLAAYEEAVDASGIPVTSRAVLLLLPWTGLRISELCQARRDALTLDAHRPGIEVEGKGQKRRWVPLVRPAREILADYQREADAAELDTSVYLFPGLRGAGPACPGTVRYHLRQLRSELPEEAQRVTPHVLRHTVATRMLEIGVPLPTIQAVLGHASMRTTERYLHPSQRMIEAAFEKLEGPATPA